MEKCNCVSTGECVDYALVYEDDNKIEKEEKRKIFEENLTEVGLILEKEEHQGLYFVKIHVPQPVLCQYAEILKLRLPIKVDSEYQPRPGLVDKIAEYFHVTSDHSLFPQERYKLTCEFSRDKEYLFETEKPDFFKASARITVINFILERESFGDGDNDKGIKRLLAEDVYKASYPLHDGSLLTHGSKRKLLLEKWASLKECIRYQPTDAIKEYFGFKCALYFTWLGFYTHMLIPASILGVICLFYAATTLSSDNLTEEICTKDIIMCPRCDKYCDYWRLSESCTYSKIQHFIDNPATIIFAIFMSFWAALYLELWKRYSAEITHRWGLTGFDLQAEPPRPEYLKRLAKTKKRKLNVITLLEEPAVSFWKVKLPKIIISFAIVFLWTILALAVVCGVVLYRMSLIASQEIYSDQTSYKIYVIPITAALLNLVCIQLLDLVYKRVAHVLTEIELHRTQTEYDDSLALKIYMFQFVNYYSSIFYIAFLKGRFVGNPGQYRRIFKLRQEECNPGGCLMELTIQLAIIMVGNQAMFAILELVIPLGFKMYNIYQQVGIMKKRTGTIIKNQDDCGYKQWVEDYQLNDFQDNALLYEYLEMVIQYGFVTIFVTAFPLAPLFALINNVLEMRLDAKKFIKYYRRPVPTRAKNIGVWFPIMGIIGRISVVSNALIIAFSSHFIPKLVYNLESSLDLNNAGFLEHSLSIFATKDFEEDTAPEITQFNVTSCRYADYRNPPEAGYAPSMTFWHLLAARFAFVVVYQNVVNFVITAVEWTIPDIPRRLNDQIKREMFLINETIIKYEAEKARERMRRQKTIPSLYRKYKGRYGDFGQSQSQTTLYYDADDTSVGFPEDQENIELNTRC